ncbi:MAG: hypothetical protein JXQ26_01970 [Tissierellales bacterium]|nr:hypothetical protein [Tissierellales bacterium]MBN2826723.1 hypothetical protein [Tissierellales bacterium]
MLEKIKEALLMAFISIIILNNGFLVSLSVMKIYNEINRHASDINLSNIEIEISKPEGDWYPLMNLFCVNHFSYGLDREVSLAIYYSFGNFSNGSSVLFDPKNELFNSFYGYYVVKDNRGYYGFTEDMQPNFSEMMVIPEFDFKYLVGSALGLSESGYQLEYDIVAQNIEQTEVTYELILKTNSIYHQYSKYNQNYLQYGKPYIVLQGKEDFFPIILYSKIKLVAYDKHTTVIYYIFSPTEEIVKSWRI